MEIKTEETQSVTILRITGKIVMIEDGGGGDEILRDKIFALLKNGKKWIILDMAQVPYVDSAGLGAMVRGYTNSVKAGGDLKLLHLNKKILDLLIVTKLVSVLDFFDSEEKALASFNR